MDKKTKRKVSKKKVIIALIILIIIVGGVIGGYLLLNQNTKENKIIKIESTDTIEGYDYVLNSNATKYYKKLFKELKNVLESDEVNEAEYADLVVKLFIADFYNLDNKINKNDKNTKNKGS